MGFHDKGFAGRQSNLSYAGKTAVRRAIEWARENDIEVTFLELGSDGTIRVGTAAGHAAAQEGDFDRLVRQGVL